MKSDNEFIMNIHFRNIYFYIVLCNHINKHTVEGDPGDQAAKGIHAANIHTAKADRFSVRST